ncbi:unnamed protein product [Ceratitis capitata]|uniref:(Mediterranean fruit fly) hypothetical protein n=1 Tax=Ceratitis capitata TaxID=7213 RepID=A0A811VAV0_CERCA|nr:unnamed protein product [Ceratitis capitata]
MLKFQLRHFWTAPKHLEGLQWAAILSICSIFLILLYPEEGWARTASSSYWTITPCWWQPNRCRIEEFTGTQRQSTKAKMVPLEQKGSLLIAGYFRRKKATSGTPLSGGTCLDCLEVGDDVMAQIQAVARKRKLMNSNCISPRISRWKTTIWATV